MLFPVIHGIATNKTLRRTIRNRRRDVIGDDGTGIKPSEDKKSETHTARKQIHIEGRYETKFKCHRHRDCSRSRSRYQHKPQKQHRTKDLTEFDRIPLV